MQELSLAVVGIEYANADKSSRGFELALLRPGEPVDLIAEPKNKHDPLAVAVHRAGGGQIGYLSAERCGWIGGRIRAGEPWLAIFQGVTGSVAWIRMRFGGDAPTLPPAAPTSPADDEDGFAPDPDGPMWGA